MKKIYLTFFVMCFIVLSTSAQSGFEKGDMTVGGSLITGSYNTTLIGISGKFQYNVTDPIRLEGSLLLIPKQDYTSFSDFSAFFHYLFPVSEKVTLYPLAGLGSMTRTRNSYSNGEFNLRLGGGIDLQLSENWFFNGELKTYLYNEDFVSILAAGVAYKF